MRALNLNTPVRAGAGKARQTRRSLSTIPYPILISSIQDHVQIRDIASGTVGASLAGRDENPAVEALLALHSPSRSAPACCAAACAVVQEGAAGDRS